MRYNVINSAIQGGFRPVKAKSAVKSAVKHTKRTLIPTNQRPFFWWELVDSNHRSITQQIYSLSPLATRESSQICAPHLVLCYYNRPIRKMQALFSHFFAASGPWPLHIAAGQGRAPRCAARLLHRYVAPSLCRPAAMLLGARILCPPFVGTAKFRPGGTGKIRKAPNLPKVFKNH